MAKTIYETLCETYPSDKDLFRENYENLISIFKNLDIEIANKLDKKINRSFIIFHPSLTYFARDYNLEQIEIEKNGKEASPVHIKDILNQSKESQVNIIFIQKEFNSKEAQYIANSIGAEIFVINPLNEDIYGELKKIGDILARKL
jgi:zinc transport system substrate-binding protein